MGFFSDGKIDDSRRVYNTKVKDYLKEKDGKQHLVFLQTLSKYFNKGFGIDEKVTIEVDEILSLMQDDGYEIIDVQFNTIKDQGYGKHTNEGYQTMIRYK